MSALSIPTTTPQECIWRGMAHYKNSSLSLSFQLATSWFLYTQCQNRVDPRFRANSRTSHPTTALNPLGQDPPHLSRRWSWNCLVLPTRVFCVKRALISSFLGQPVQLGWALGLESDLGASFVLDPLAWSWRGQRDGKEAIASAIRASIGREPRYSTLIGGLLWSPPLFVGLYLNLIVNV